jgi:hypothetical protein
VAKKDSYQKNCGELVTKKRDKGGRHAFGVVRIAYQDIFT